MHYGRTGRTGWRRCLYREPQLRRPPEIGPYKMNKATINTIVNGIMENVGCFEPTEKEWRQIKFELGKRLARQYYKPAVIIPQAKDKSETSA